MSENKPEQNFQTALNKLKEFVALPATCDRDRAGIIQAFEFTFEQCWKALQKVAQSEGLDAKSPRQSLECGIQLGLIKCSDEDIWLSMLKDRNMTSHLYHSELVEGIYTRVVSSYLDQFEKISSSFSKL